MSRTRRSRGRRRTSGGAGYIVLGVVLLLACVAVGGGYAWLVLNGERRPQLVAETLCPVDGPRSVTVVLVDFSDDIGDAGRIRVGTYLQDVASTLPEYGLLEMRLLDPTVGGGRTVFTRCNPGDGSNLSELVANPEAVKRRWNADFQKPLSEAVEKSLAPSGAETSPLMATIQRIAAERFEGRKNSGAEKRLIIVSDMIEHGPRYSQYREGTAWERYESSPGYRAYATDLNRAAVSILCIQREQEKFGTRAHMDFWDRWIERSNGTLEEAQNVQGIS